MLTILYGVETSALKATVFIFVSPLKSACSAMTRKHMFSVLTLMTPYHAQLSKGMSGNLTGRTWQILSWRLKIPVTCSTKFQVHLTMKVSYFEYRKVTKYIYINYIYTSFIITRERNCYSTLLGTIDVEIYSIRYTWLRLCQLCIDERDTILIK